MFRFLQNCAALSLGRGQLEIYVDAGSQSVRVKSRGKNKNLRISGYLLLISTAAITNSKSQTTGCQSKPMPQLSHPNINLKGNATAATNNPNMAPTTPMRAPKIPATTPNSAAPTANQMGKVKINTMMMRRVEVELERAIL
jgi:hypothetical protein